LKKHSKFTISDPQLQNTFKGHLSPVTSIDIHANGSEFLSSSNDGSILIHHFNSRPFNFIGHKGGINESCYSSAGSLIASASEDMTVRIWENSYEGRSVSLKGHIAAVKTVNFSNNDLFLLTGSSDKSLRLWTVTGQTCETVLSGHVSTVNSARFSPDGRLAASASDDQTVKLWDLRQEETIFDWVESRSSVKCVRFHPDGTALAFSTADGKVLIKDVRSQRFLNRFEGHSAEVSSLSFHPSGEFLITGSDDCTLKVWDLKMAKAVYTLIGHDNPVLAVKFTPNGRQFISAGADSRIMLWNCDGCSGSRANHPTRPGEIVKTTEKNIKNPENFKNNEKRTASVTRPTSRQDILEKTVVLVVDERKKAEQGKSLMNTQKTQKRTQSVDLRPFSRLAVRTTRKSEVPEEVSGNIEKLVGQMDTVTKTLVILEQRFSKFEDHVKMLYKTTDNMKSK
jgi:centriolar protein POC1